MIVVVYGTVATKFSSATGWIRSIPPPLLVLAHARPPARLPTVPLCASIKKKKKKPKRKPKKYILKALKEKLCCRFGAGALCRGAGEVCASYPVCAAAAAVAPDWSDAVTVLHRSIVALCGPRSAGEIPLSESSAVVAFEWSGGLGFRGLMIHTRASSASAGHALLVKPLLNYERNYERPKLRWCIASLCGTHFAGGCIIYIFMFIPHRRHR